MKKGFIQIPVLITIIVGILIVGSAGYLVVKKVNQPTQVIPSEEVIKNSSEESTTTVVDADSTYLKEEIARKKQRDTDRNKCIADAEAEYAKFKAQNPECVGNLGTYCLSRVPKVRENIDRCYFRFPNN